MESTSLLEPHQQRVVCEKQELDARIDKLKDFIGNNPIFDSLEKDEQYRLKRQYNHMCDYSDVLGERIEAFTH